MLSSTLQSKAEEGTNHTLGQSARARTIPLREAISLAPWLQSLYEDSGYSAPKARNVIAQGNALGKGHNNPGSAEGAT